MIILAITTSTDEGSLALGRQGEILVQKNWTRGAQHTDVLTANIKQALEKKGVTPENLAAIAVDRGPGSFTGCRLAVNVARTMAYSLNIPIYPAYSLDILAQGPLEKLKKKTRFLTLLDAHKSLTYGRLYQVDEEKKAETLTDVKAWSIGELEEMCAGGIKVFGDASKEVKKDLKKCGAVFSQQKKTCFPQASVLSLMASEAFLNNDKSKFKNWTEVEPSYIRVPDAVMKMFPV